MSTIVSVPSDLSRMANIANRLQRQLSSVSHNIDTVATALGERFPEPDEQMAAAIELLTDAVFTLRLIAD